MRRAIVACCQLAINIDDPADTLTQIRASLHEATQRGADIIVLPELAHTGYLFADAGELAERAEPLTGPYLQLLSDYAAQHHAIVISGFAEKTPGAIYNAAVLVDYTGLRAVYRKAHLWDHEKTCGFTPGSGPPPVVTTRFGRIAMMVCYDLEFPEWVRMAALTGAHLLAAPVNWPRFPRPDGERPAELIRSQANAAVNRIHVAIADRVGQERGQDWVGGSAILDPDGFPVALATENKPGIITAAITMADAESKSISAHNDVFSDRRPELYRL